MLIFTQVCLLHFSGPLISFEHPKALIIIEVLEYLSLDQAMVFLMGPEPFKFMNW